MENCNNREITFKVNYNGQSIAFTTLMKNIGIDIKHYPAIRGRINRGWEHQKAIDTPVKKGNYK